MTDRDERSSWERMGEGYNPPPETPREVIWARIASRIDASGVNASTREGASAATGCPTCSEDQPVQAPGARGPRVVDPGAARRISSGERGAAPRGRRWRGWAVAAAALLVLGIGIGRMSAPTGPRAAGPEAPPLRSAHTGLGLAAREHLGRTESLLTMVRADARDGRVDPAVGEWAEGLLSQTRLLLDRTDGVDPELRDLLLDLELVLAQVVGVARSGPGGERSRTEMEMTLETLDEGGILPRLRATLPSAMSGA